MNSCANCGLCYIDPTKEKDTYRCMRGVRAPITDLFVLGRINCIKHVEVEILLEVK